MMEENKKVVLNFTEVKEGNGIKEVIVREGQAPKILDPKAPIKINISGTIKAPVEFLSKRISEIDQIDPKRCHVLINRENLAITLITSEDNEYLQGVVKGALTIHPKFQEFGINQNKTWEPSELGQFFKMNRSFFPNREENMKLVTDLKNFSATVNSTMDRHNKENGSMKFSYGQVVNSNLPEAFALNIPIFRGANSVDVMVECYATIDGSEVSLQLFSPGANQLIEEMRDSVIDEQIAAIQELSSEIVIIEQ